MKYIVEDFSFFQQFHFYCTQELAKDRLEMLCLGKCWVVWPYAYDYGKERKPRNSRKKNQVKIQFGEPAQPTPASVLICSNLYRIMQTMSWEECFTTWFQTWIFQSVKSSPLPSLERLGGSSAVKVWPLNSSGLLFQPAELFIILAGILRGGLWWFTCSR